VARIDYIFNYHHDLEFGRFQLVESSWTLVATQDKRWLDTPRHP
jgi:hypothetical protein